MRAQTGHLVGRECSLLTASEAKRTPAALIVLADRIRRLSTCHRDPERFHIDKSEIERDLRRLAKGGVRG